MVSERIVMWAELSEHGDVDDMWVAIFGKAYDVTEWSKWHPGGQLVLVFLAGKDASSQFEAYHPESVHQQLGRWEVGTMEKSCNAPSKIEDEFAVLKEQIIAAGLMKKSIWPYFRLFGLIASLLALSVSAGLNGYLIASALLLALFWQQLAFIGHDLGHSSVASTSKSHFALGLLTNAGLGIGMSWWKSTHNVHHIVVNAADSDPDIQFMPLLASSEHFFEPVWSRYHQDQLEFDATAKLLISWQHITFFPLLMIARYGLYLQTIKQLVSGKAFINRTAEIAAQVFFFAWYASFVSLFPGLGRRLAFVLLSHAAFFVLHLQICLSHFACPTTKDFGEAADLWMVHQVEGTMNWTCPEWLDWFHGGLQFQIEHHLFPRMPRQNLRAASKYVRAACMRCGLRYHSPGFLEAIVETVQVLRSAAQLASKHKTSRAPLPQIAQHTVLSRGLL